MRLQTTAFVGIVAIGLGAAGCGGSSSPDPGTTATSAVAKPPRATTTGTAEQQIRATYKVAVGALAADDGPTACQYYTADAQRGLRFSAQAFAKLPKTPTCPNALNIIVKFASGGVKYDPNEALKALKLDGSTASARTVRGVTHFRRVGGRWLLDAATRSARPKASS